MHLTSILLVCLAGSGYSTQPSASHLYDAQVDRGDLGPYPVSKFISSLAEAPKVNFKQWSPECDDGLYYFITPRGWKVSRPGPMILDGSGEVVWSEHFRNDYGGQAYDLRVQKYQGESVLTFWLGDDRIRGHGFGHYFMLNSSYDVIRTVGAAGGAPADLHEFLITPKGTALIIVYEVTTTNATLPGRRLSDFLFGVSYVWDNVIQEIDIQSGSLVFEWRASEHVNMNDTYRELHDTGTQQDPFDWFHVNSVDKDEAGNYLICVRYTHAIYYIDGKSKEIIWTLGGKANSFMDLSEGRALNFAWQHDARFVDLSAFPNTYKPRKNPKSAKTKLMTLFDNAAEDWNYAYGPDRSRGMLLELSWPRNPKKSSVDVNLNHLHETDLTIKTAPNGLSSIDAQKIASINQTDPAYAVRLIKEYITPARVRSSSQGSLQLLSQSKRTDPRVLVDYGLAAMVTEFSANGTALCDIRFGAETSWETGDVQSYRAYKLPWVGHPKLPPNIAIKSNTIYISWNGATAVHQWKLQASETGNATDWLKSEVFAKNGFETAYRLPLEFRTSRFLRVLALDANGKHCEFGTAVFDHGKFNALLRQHVTTNHTLATKTMIVLLCSVFSFYTLFVIYRICTRRYSFRQNGKIKHEEHRSKQV